MPALTPPSLPGSSLASRDEVGVVATPAELDAVSGQATIAAAVGRYFRRAADEAPLVLVVEDLHFATATTRATVRHIARSSTHAPILTLITTRDTAPDVDDELRVLLGDLARMPAVDNIDLGGLPAAEVADLLARLGSTADSTTVTNETGGNPLLVVEVARSRRDTPASLHAMLARRYALLTEADLPVVDVASVVGTEFDARRRRSHRGLRCGGRPGEPRAHLGSRSRPLRAGSTGGVRVHPRAVPASPLRQPSPAAHA